MSRRQPHRLNRPPDDPASPGLLEVAGEAHARRVPRRSSVERGYGDIRPTHGCVFRFVREDGMRLTELAELAGITKQSAGEIVDDLVALGYVERIPDPDDSRAKLICLTDRGGEAQRIGFGLFAEVEQRWAERYGPERIAAAAASPSRRSPATRPPHAVPELTRADATAPA